jgi:hypothetical protein
MKAPRPRARLLGKIIPWLLCRSERIYESHARCIDTGNMPVNIIYVHVHQRAGAASSDRAELLARPIPSSIPPPPPPTTTRALP